VNRRVRCEWGEAVLPPGAVRRIIYEGMAGAGGRARARSFLMFRHLPNTGPCLPNMGASRGVHSQPSSYHAAPCEHAREKHAQGGACATWWHAYKSG
jgi:hypothetical protein